MWFQFECVLNMYQVRNPCSEMSVEPMDAMKMGFMYGVRSPEYTAQNQISSPATREGVRIICL